MHKKYLEPNPNLEGVPADIAALFHDFFDSLQGDVGTVIQDYTEWTKGMDYLVQAKDHFVRSVLP